MKNHPPQFFRLLALALSSKGLGFAVLEGRATLADWGNKLVTGDKNTGALKKVGELIAHYEPDMLVLPATNTPGSRRSVRIRKLGEALAALAATHKLKTRLLTREQVLRECITGDQEHTKHGLAACLAVRYPEELGDRLPPKRRPWKSEDYRMDIFEAVALALACRLRQDRRRKPGPTKKRGA